MVAIKTYPAKNGDAFLIKATNSPFAMLVDGGYADTFQRHIKSDLVNLATSGFKLDLVVATHIDADHISGLLAFFHLNGKAEAPTIIPVCEVLHNSLRNLVTATKGQPLERSDDLALLRAIRQRGYPPRCLPNSQEQEISARQGSSLAHLLREGGYHWNSLVGGDPVGSDEIANLELPKAKIKILSPNNIRLEALKKWWISEIRSLGMIGSLDGELDDVFEFLCAHEVVGPGNQMLASSDAELSDAYVPDNSVTNGSSIAMIVEVESRRLLFLGDSWADDVVAALRPVGLTIFDAIKISHHGSARNTNLELLSLIDSPNFFISTNGDGHNHPDFAVLRAIVDRPATFRRTLYFNYSTPVSRKLITYRSKADADFTVYENQTSWVEINELDTI